jgi:PAS domain S-box-containing protein
VEALSLRSDIGISSRRVILSVVAGILILFAIGYLSLSVSSDLRLLNSARSDNVQWTLSQSEVEFLKFDSHLTEALIEDEPDLKTLRREFDIFYSRINTLSQSELYANLREIPAFSSNLAHIHAFLKNSIPLIDGSDDVFLAGLADLKKTTMETRQAVRVLSNSGLNYFATDSDKRRASVSTTLTQLAFAVGLLLLILVFLAIYLGVVNAQNVRRRAEITQTSDRMKIVTGTSLDAVIVSDAEGRILEFNTAAESMFGHNAEDVIGADLGKLMVPDHHRAAHTAGMERMRNKGEKHVVGKGRVKLESKRSNGDIFPVELAIQSAETEGGEIFIAFLRDISHRVKAEQELVEARDIAVAGGRSKSDFLATMSHEIRTPLNGILGNLSLLGDTRLNTQQSNYLKNMKTSGRLLMSHISDVLDITKYDAGKLQLRPMAMNLSELLQDIADSQAGAAMANNSVLEWGWNGPAATWINADRERIQHILINMIGNAVKFTHDGRITLEAQILAEGDAAPEIHIGVRDTGIGIDADLQATIFDDFVTGDSSYDRDVGGTGLGLGIARRFVEALGGQIGMESTKGEGSYFWVRFPIERIDAPEAVTETKLTSEFGQNRKILLVEDNEINRFVAREMLNKAGHIVTEAHDGKAGVRQAEIEHFDLILMDISMPVMDGRTATRAIRSGNGLSARTPIVALTANAMAEEQEAFLSDGMNAILTKPLSRDALETVVAKWANAVQSVQATISSDHLVELRETVGDETFGSLVDRFSAEIDALINWLSAENLNDHSDVAKRAHKAAGSAATFGAKDLRATLIEIETAAKSDDSDQLAKACGSLPSIWAATKDEITSVRCQ